MGKLCVDLEKVQFKELKVGDIVFFDNKIYVVMRRLRTFLHKHLKVELRVCRPSPSDPNYLSYEQLRVTDEDLLDYTLRIKV